ncbi:MAG: bifunctional DNA-formamidopyrimidine glycosylase/DNA-(apurinic or apyrimidinic site) lyase [Patescibacteria group bacterium]
MPELPEVETIRRDLGVLVGKKITDLKIISPKTASHSAAFFKKTLLGRRLIKIERRGKLLIFAFSSDVFLLVHLKMTGQLIYQSGRNKIVGGHSLGGETYEKSVGGELPNKYTRAIFYFSGGGELYFNDLRKFGYLKLVNKEELAAILKNNYGPEPLTSEFTAERLETILKKRSTNIKAVLLNQKLIAGLGNIYVDEALFAAGILPTRPANKIKPAETAKLVKEINKLITRAIFRRGTTFNNYVDSKGKQGNFSRYLRVYGRKNEKCLVCGSSIIRIKLAGRGTHYCSNCQK